MRKIISVILVGVIALLSLSSCKNEEFKKFSEYYFDFFDTATTITGYEKTKEDFDKVCSDIKAQLYEYHKLYDIYKRYDGINNLYVVNSLHNGEHKETVVDQKIIELLEFSKEVHEKTSGKVNVAMGSVLSIWHDYRSEGENDPSRARLPEMSELQEASLHTSIDSIVIDKENKTVFISDPKSTLDVGAVAKGYVAEKIAEHLRNQGKIGYVINLGGNVCSVGGRHDGSPWAVGIENPDTENEDKPYIAYLHISGESVVTSGVYQRYYYVGGKRYHHIIDPDTLMPAENFMSVSIICKNSAMGDAYSTALFSMNYEDGLALIEADPDAEALWVLNSGEVKFSSGFSRYTYEP